jgi:hydrogenase small subunit
VLRRIAQGFPLALEPTHALREDGCDSGRSPGMRDALGRPEVTVKTWLLDALASRGLSRRDFTRFCASVAAFLSLPEAAAQEMARAVDKSRKPSLVWLEFQDCAGDTESLLRASRPTVASVILDAVSVDYHETIMAAAGDCAEAAREAILEQQAGRYLAVVEGAIPTGESGAYCTIGGRSALEIARRICKQAAATIAVGNCAAFGGLPAAAPNPTGALGVAAAVPGLKNLINLPACPANVENLTALLVYFLTFSRWPPLDRDRRPLFAYGKSIHDNCERRAHFDAGQYVESWGDAAHRAGYCLYKLGCKGPVTFHNCPTVRWNEGTNWPVGCGHPCVGCTEASFWDRMTPFYQHLSGIVGFNLATSIDRVGLYATGGVAAGLAVHGAVSAARLVRARRSGKKPEERDRSEATPARSAEGDPEDLK